MSTGRIEKYVSVFNIGLQNTFVYRWNYFLRALFGLIPLAGTVFLWSAVFKERGGGLHGYDYGSMIYYYLLTILVSNLVTPTEDEWQIAADIREGQINALLTKPMSYLAYRFSIFLSGRLVYTFVTLPPIALIFIYFRDYIVLPTDRADLRVCHVSMLMAAFIQFFHHLQPCDDGVLDSGNLDHRFHRLFVRILPRRPDVSNRTSCRPPFRP
jgi:ABC-2 type transport system permease protein